MRSNRHTEQPGSLVEQLAQGKATAVELDPDDMLVAADTIIYVDGQVRGKPADLDEARRALLSYSNNEHDVYTGVCIRFRQTCKTFHIRSRVTFGQNSHELIEWYLSTGEYKDKAGGYGTQAIGAALVAGINGCYYNIMGLPVHRLIQEILALTSSTAE